MYENLVFYQLTNDESSRVLHLIEAFNRDRTETNGVYIISLATAFRPYYILWRVFPDEEFIPLRTLAITFEQAVKRAFDLLKYCKVALRVVNSTYVESYYVHQDLFIPFGRYNGKRLAEVLYVDPSYILWLANKFSSTNPRFDLLRTQAKLYATVHNELTYKQRYFATESKHVGEKGERLTDFYLSVLNVRLQVDTYKPDFYVDQNVLAVDQEGNRYTFILKAPDRSMSPNQLSCYSRAIQKQETLHVKSAKVMRHYESHGIKYTRLGYVKLY